MSYERITVAITGQEDLNMIASDVLIQFVVAQAGVVSTTPVDGIVFYKRPVLGDVVIFGGTNMVHQATYKHLFFVVHSIMDAKTNIAFSELVFHALRVAYETGLQSVSLPFSVDGYLLPGRAEVATPEDGAQQLAMGIKKAADEFPEKSMGIVIGLSNDYQGVGEAIVRSELKNRLGEEIFW